MAKIYGVLSGVEIVEAVERQQEYRRLRAKACPDLDGDTTISWWESWKLGRLEKQPRIHIDGFDPMPSDQGGRVNPNSYNLDIGDELMVYNIPLLRPEQRFGIHLPNSPVEWDGYMLDCRKDNPTKSFKIPEEGFVLMPDRLYLAKTKQHTESFNVRPCLAGRSSIGRLGLSVHITAGYGDAGFCGTWTLELMAIHPLRIYAGMPICQIDYATISPRHRPYRSKKYQGQVGVTASKLFMELNNGKGANGESQKSAPGLRPSDLRGENITGGSGVRTAAERV